MVRLCLRFLFFILGFVFSGCFNTSWIKNLNLASIDDSVISKPSCDPQINNNYGGGDGSSAKPFTICTLSQWDYFSTRSSDFSASFKLEADLDFSGVSSTNFKSIGALATPFTGKFDGGNKSIMNISALAATVPIALFLNTGGSAEIRNLTIKNFTLQSSARGAALVLDHVGTGTLLIESVTLNNISMTLPYVDGIGALIGHSVAGVDIRNLNATDISLDIDGRQSGGIVGNVDGQLDVVDSRVERLTLIGEFMNTDYAGGFVGSVGNFLVQSPGVNIRDLTMIDIVTDTGWTGAGVLGQAYMSGPVFFQRVNVTGTLNSAGGQSGLINTTSAANVTVEDSSFQGTLVNAGNASYGGLVGTVYGGSATIRRSFYSGIASVWSGTFGGLIAYAQNSVLVEDSYVLGNRSTTHATQGTMSGLVGTSGASANVTIRRSFYAGAFSGTNTPARSCILKFQGTGVLTVEDVYYDSTQCTLSSNYLGPVLGSTGAATATLQSAIPFLNWSTMVWSFDNGRYPRLVWQE